MSCRALLVYLLPYVGVPHTDGQRGIGRAIIRCFVPLQRNQSAVITPKLSHGACILLSGVLCESHASGYEATCHRANIPPEISSSFDCLAGTDCLLLCFQSDHARVPGG